ncbi:hypothetical protein CPLU01_11488 [Colletotrichum plurivorum]|uniref:Uncharacterized protein n=1 Tax=Colletotrichum plurivorum TaxID=2175906 RepID=A0A8H6K227_9PEZI|nr:hypothetical protein CPLU01_11488 [Colletotrichum plurivorum]
MEEPTPREYALSRRLFVDRDKHFPTTTNAILQSMTKLPYFSSASDDEFAGLPEFKVPDLVFPPETDGLREGNLDELATNAVGVGESDDLLKLALEASVPHNRFCHAVRKLELPSLRSDPRHDLKALNKIISEAKHHDFFRRPNTLPLDPVDDTLDEGLAIPRSAVHFHDQLTRGAEPDELDFSEEDLAYVVESVYQDWTEKDLQDLISLEVDPLRQRLQSMTPPLVATAFETSSSPEPFIPDGDVCKIYTFSDPPSLLDADLQDAGKALEVDSFEQNFVDESAMFFASTPEDDFELPATKQRVEDFKMESPVLHTLEKSPSPANEEASCKELIKSVPDLLPSPTIRFEDRVEDGDSEFLEQFNLLIESGAADMNMRAEQEQIQEADATARMQPPVMDFSVPGPEWAMSASNALEMFQWIRKQYGDQFKPPPWRRNRVDELKLKWSLLPLGFRDVETREIVGDLKLLSQLLPLKAAPTITSADFVRKRCGLKIFNHDDDDEIPVPKGDDAPALILYEPADSLLELTRKRKLSLLMDGESVEPCSPTVERKSRTKSRKRRETSGGGLLLGGNESDGAGKLLDNYLKLRPPKESKWSRHGAFPPTPEKSASSSSTAGRSSLKPLKAPAPQQQLHVRSAIAPCPESAPLEGQAQIVISIGIPRNILSALQRNLPDIDLVDRDFNRYNTWAWSPGSTKRVEIASPLAFEADIIPSPRTGIIATKIVEVCQKPKPDATCKVSPIQERMTRVAPLYEQLIILVTEGNPTEEYIGPLSAASLQAYNSFVGAASAVGSTTGCSITVMYVGGGNKTLEKWICALVSTHIRENPPKTRNLLIEDETEWELFLRRAGFNMYAAQLVISAVKGMCHGETGVAPLVRFLGMAPAERARALAGFLGAGRAPGEGVVGRVSARLG